MVFTLSQLIRAPVHDGTKGKERGRGGFVRGSMMVSPLASLWSTHSIKCRFALVALQRKIISWIVFSRYKSFFKKHFVYHTKFFFSANASFSIYSLWFPISCANDMSFIRRGRKGVVRSISCGFSDCNGRAWDVIRELMPLCPGKNQQFGTLIVVEPIQCGEGGKTATDRFPNKCKRGKINFPRLISGEKCRQWVIVRAKRVCVEVMPGLCQKSSKFGQIRKKSSIGVTGTTYHTNVLLWYILTFNVQKNELKAEFAFKPPP